MSRPALRLKSTGLHLRLCKAALNGEHILDVLGIGKLAQREAGLGVLLGEPDRSQTLSREFGDERHASLRSMSRRL